MDAPGTCAVLSALQESPPGRSLYSEKAAQTLQVAGDLFFKLHREGLAVLI